MLQVAPGLTTPVQEAISVGVLSAKSPSCAPLGPEIPLSAKVGWLIATCPLLTTSTVNAALENPISTVPIFTVAGETAIAGGERPVPLSVTDAEATPTLVVLTVSVAVVAPVATGEKVTATVQLAFAATVAPQVVVPIEKLCVPALEPAPEMEKLGCPSGAPPLLVMVTVLAAVGILICSLPKLIVAGDRLISGGFSPVPLSFTDCARSASEITSVPVSPAATLGVKVTEIEHDEFAASWLPQLFTAIKSAEPRSE